MELKSKLWSSNQWSSNQWIGNRWRSNQWRSNPSPVFTSLSRSLLCFFVLILLVSCTPTKKTNHAVGSGKNKETGDSEAQIADPGTGNETGSTVPDSELKPPTCPSSGEISIKPIIWSNRAGKLRWWHEENLLEEVKSSKEKPVEVCGVKGQLKWLMKAYCPDGKHPFKSLREAHNSRAGSMGAGGRCGKIVDLYRVPCETKVYEVYMSLYHCTESERSLSGDSPGGSP